MQALLARRAQAGDTAASTDVKDLWVDPLVVSYLKIGFRKLDHSLHGIVHLALRHSQDVAVPTCGRHWSSLIQS